MLQRSRSAGYKPTQATVPVVVIVVEELACSHLVYLGSSYSNGVYHLAGLQYT